ncbi:bifunctional transcriptional activator/DNA repair enzyme AdaA [Paenibacillus sp. y28]|uniref:bifunctional transcriptional activator/DNA repair enzyme AdaA n=1 Tax=Paenibacillus sp. y28 TaxID=3129110 RepID=UPI00301657EB
MEVIRVNKREKQGREEYLGLDRSLQEHVRGEHVTERQWQAIVANDAAYDGMFFYAVKTTGIFCRPSCKSKTPNKENVWIFPTPKHALSAHFRPCKRCKPTGERLPDTEWVAQMTQYIDQNYKEALTLGLLADMCHGSPYHLHRTFKRVKGITPMAYIQQVRMGRAKELLAGSDDPMTDIVADVGLPNLPYFITLFKKMTGYTPAEYRRTSRNKRAAALCDSAEGGNDEDGPTVQAAQITSE